MSKRVLSLTKAGGRFATPWPQFWKIEKSIWRHYFAVSGPVWMKFGMGQMLNHVEKQQILL